VPDIAENWELSDDGTTYTFHLRDDVKFHDGKPVTAQDFKYSIERACDPATRSVVADTYLGDIVGAQAKLRGQADEISGVVVIDEHTLEITIDSPKAYFLSKLTYPTAFVVDQENVEGPVRPWTDKPNGTGPFRLAEYELGFRIVLERNEAYYGTPKPALERVNFVLAGGSAMTMYETGELDAVPVGLTDIDRVMDPSNPLNKELSVVRPTFTTSYIGFNVNRPPFDDVKVRQAFSYALDKDKLIDVVAKKTAIKAHGILPPGLPGYNPNLKSHTFDPEKARQLIAESSYRDVSNFPEITLNVSGGGGATSRQTTAIVEMYKQNLGVDVTIEQTDWATYLNDLNARRYQMFSVGWIADYPDPQDFLDILFHSQSLDNRTGYSNPDVDRLLEQARVEQDQEQRFDLYRQAEQIIVDEAPWVPLAHGVEYWLTKPYVKGMIYPPMIIPKLKYVSINK
jgi:ABC-type transport system substrate-binding protein